MFGAKLGSQSKWNRKEDGQETQFEGSFDLPVCSAVIASECVNLQLFANGLLLWFVRSASVL